MIKSNKSIALLFVLLCLGGNAFAKPVDVQTARTVALNFYKHNPNAIIRSNMAVVLNYTKTEADSSVDFYVFDIYPVHSFVIVSGNDIVKPVIAYSTESYFTNDVSSKVGVSDWVNHSSAKINYAVQHNLTATSQIQNSWLAYINGNNSAAVRGTGKGPLLSTNWNQEPYFNDLCPMSSNGQRCVTGCVATTMAQIMKFWNYPAHGTGSFSYTDNGTNDIGTLSANFGATNYNWYNMPATLNSPNTDVATLMYQCGVSVTMDYGDDSQDGSGSYVLIAQTPHKKQSAEYSYKTYFSYNPNTLQGVYQSDYATSDWINLMENEINNGRPLQYEGQDTHGYGGHTWVCDGYDASGLLHMNWGWGGSDNGYFDVTDLNPEVYNFDNDDAALIGIVPLATVHITASVTSSIICKGKSTTTLTAKGPTGATYSWSPATGLACATCISTTANPSSTTTYVLKVDSSGVIATQAVVVNVATGINSSFIPDVTSVCSTPGSVSFSNSSGNALSYVWEFGDGTSSTAAAPTHVYNSIGQYTVKLIATGPCGVDSMTKPQLINVNNNAPSANGQAICKNQTATLTASGSGTISWYISPTGGKPIGTGTSFVTPYIYAPSTYYAESDIAYPVVSCSPADYTLGSASSYTGSYFSLANIHSIIFNCFRSQTLLSVDVYANGQGDRVIELSDSAGNVLTSQTFTLPDGGSTVNLNYQLPIGNNFKLSCAGNVELYRNSAGAVYPYYSSDSSVVLTNSDAGTPGYYYYFYNWQLQKPGCESGRVAVNVSLLNPGTSFTTKITGTTINFIPANPDATSFSWNFGDGTTSTEATPTHTYATGGAFVIHLSETGVCTDQFTQTVNLKATGVNDVQAIESFSLAPNPVSGTLIMEAGIDNAADGYVLNIENMLGETVISRNIHLNNGSNRLSIDVSQLASGMYLFRLTVKDGQVAAYRKFVKD